MAVVDNGKQAVDWLRSNTPDILILDVEMPVMDGLAVAKYVRNDTQLQGLPIIGVTGHSEPQALAACRGAGMDSVISKPVNQAQLIAFMLDLLNRKRKAS